MGLKTTNYEVERLGSVLPTAYAIIKKLYVKDDFAIAEFAIQANREAATNKDAYETVEIKFTPNRNESPYITAYKIAKGQHYEFKHNEETNKTEKVVVNNSIFYGWEDDIQ